MTEELKALKEVLTRLAQLKVPYMLTGSVALQYYAIPRMTRDVDIVIQISEKDVPALVKAFQTDFYIDELTIRDAIEHQSLFNIVHNASVTKVDLIIQKGAPYRKVEFDRRQKVMFFGAETWIVSAEDLIISKLDWARDSFSEQQFRDVSTLLRTAPNLDLKYIDKWVKELRLQSVYEKVKK